jgi:hypothetical protein
MEEGRKGVREERKKLGAGGKYGCRGEGEMGKERKG